MANFMSSELGWRLPITITVMLFLANCYFQYKINEAQMQLNAAQMKLNEAQATLNKAQGELNDSVLRLTLAIKDNKHIVNGP